MVIHSLILQFRQKVFGLFTNINESFPTTLRNERSQLAPNSHPSAPLSLGFIFETKSFSEILSFFQKLYNKRRCRCEKNSGSERSQHAR